MKPRIDPSERIAALNRQIADLKERRRRAEGVLRARQQRLENAERAKARKRETRWKIVAGGMVLAEARDDPRFREQLREIFSRRVSARERRLFEDWRDRNPEPAASSGKQAARASLRVRIRRLRRSLWRRIRTRRRIMLPSNEQTPS